MARKFWAVVALLAFVMSVGTAAFAAVADVAVPGHIAALGNGHGGGGSGGGNGGGGNGGGNGHGPGDGTGNGGTGPHDGTGYGPGGVNPDCPNKALPPSA